MELKLIQTLEYMSNRLANIEKNIFNMDEKLDYSIALQRNHLIRVKNGEDIDDNAILMGRPYNDLTPQKAYDIYCRPGIDYIFIDVTKKDFSPKEQIKGVIKIPLEELGTRYTEIYSKTTPILIISEVGLRSILACEMLVRKGFYNINNISGGHRFWPTMQEEDIENILG